MAFSRYTQDGIIRNGTMFATAQAVSAIRQAIKENAIEVSETVFTEATRLDVLAGENYGDGTLWWVIAAASNIGWGLQVPPGTKIVIPTSIAQIKEIEG